MTAQEQRGRVPDVSLGWRLKIALGVAHVKAEDMADELGVSRQTLSRWMADQGAPPRRPFLIYWADRTDTDLAWLEHGVTGSEPPPSPTPRGTDLDRLTRGKRPRGSKRGDSPTPQYAAA
jgi:transcriptional regulator with XRE-family HTH domain